MNVPKSSWLDGETLLYNSERCHLPQDDSPDLYKVIKVFVAIWWQLAFVYLFILARRLTVLGEVKEAYEVFF